MNDETIRFNAALGRTVIDAEGESKVTLVIPLSDVKRVMELLGWVQTGLLVTVTKAPA